MNVRADSPRAARRARLPFRRCLAGFAALAAAASAAGEIFPMSPRATYLRASQDNPAPPIVVDLTTVRDGCVDCGGEWIRITALGDFSVGATFADAFVSMSAVFSGSSIVLPATELHRVPGALAAGLDYVSGPTWYGHLPTDIPEDFAVGLSPDQRTVDVQVPQGAGFVIIGLVESYFADNLDPDGDLAVEVTLIQTTGAPCTADVNGDRQVNLTDLATQLVHFGTPSGALLYEGDLDGDSDVDLADLATLLVHFGDVCP